MTTIETTLRGDHEVIVVGAGPAGLTLANLLAAQGIDVLVLEASADILGYPRAVGVDDESLRTFQGLMLADQMLPHLTPNQRMMLLDSRRRTLAVADPPTQPYGWPRRNGFIQPLVDRVLVKGLDRYTHARIAFSHNFLGYDEVDGALAVDVLDDRDERVRYRARFLVGADGGRSSVRKAAGIGFPGTTSPSRWMVVDIEDDPVGALNATTICDPERPVVSIKLPHGVRRLEFKLHDNETDESVVAGPGLRAMLALMIDDPDAVTVIRARVYAHHSRLAARFRLGRVMLAGDAAHLMPVWLGQGYNSGIRDALNLGWKLVSVLRGLAEPQLLDTYDVERRPHAQAMVELSTQVGRIVTTPSRRMAAVRNATFHALKAIPPLRAYVLQMRFKPMPAYEDGAIAAVETAGVAAAALGRLLPQPFVTTPNGRVRLDDVLGTGWALLGWTTDPRRYMDDAALAFWKRLGATVVIAVPNQQLEYRIDRNDAPDVTLVGDDGALSGWFTELGGGLVAVRPDHIVALASSPQRVSAASASLRTAFRYRAAVTDRALTRI